MKKKCSSDRENLLKFEAEGREFSKFLRSLEQFIQTVHLLISTGFLKYPLDCMTKQNEIEFIAQKIIL